MRNSVPMNMRRTATAAVILAACGLAACVSAPPEQRTAAPRLTTATPAQMVAAIRAAAGDAEGELAVQPLRDPMVEDLRERAERLEAEGRPGEAAAALDQALDIVADDPALLQERAEIAVLQEDFPRAAQLAERAFSLGAQVGPLCRRHWATLEQVRLVEGDAPGAESARAQVDGCKVAPPPRY